MATPTETPNPTPSPASAAAPIPAAAAAAASASAGKPIDSASQVTKAPQRPRPPFSPATKEQKQSAEGWWSVRGVKGAREAVVRAVQADATIPAHWQAALAAEIANHKPEFGKLILHVDISPLAGFVGEGAVTVDAHFAKQNPNGSSRGPSGNRS